MSDTIKPSLGAATILSGQLLLNSGVCGKTIELCVHSQLLYFLHWEIALARRNVRATMMENKVLSEYVVLAKGKSICRMCLCLFQWRQIFGPSMTEGIQCKSTPIRWLAHLSGLIVGFCSWRVEYSVMLGARLALVSLCLHNRLGCCHGHSKEKRLGRALG